MAKSKKQRAAERRWCAANRERRKVHLRRAALKFYYGLSVDDYEALHDLQGGVCAVCEQKETFIRLGVVQRLSVDHDHSTGAVRGLLCYACNVALGMLRDDPARIERLKQYIERAGK